MKSAEDFFEAFSSYAVQYVKTQRLPVSQSSAIKHDAAIAKLSLALRYKATSILFAAHHENLRDIYALSARIKALTVQLIQQYDNEFYRKVLHLIADEESRLHIASEDCRCRPVALVLEEGSLCWIHKKILSGGLP